MTANDRRLLLYPLLGILLAIALGLLLAKQQPEVGAVTMLLQYLIPPLTALIYVVCAQRVSLHMKNAGRTDADRLLLLSIIPVFFITCIIYPAMVYKLLRGEDPFNYGMTITREYRFYQESEAFDVRAFQKRDAVAMEMALPAIRDFNRHLGFVCHAEPVIEGWTVQLGGRHRYSSSSPPYGEYVVDPKRRQVRRFTYQKTEYYWKEGEETEPVPVPLTTEALDRRMAQCAAALTVPAGAVPVKDSDRPGIAVMQSAPEQLDLAVPLSERTLSWRKEYRGIPYLFNRIQMTFDPSGRMVFYTNDWTDSVPSDIIVRVERDQAIALGREQLRVKMKESDEPELQVTDTWCALAIVQAVHEEGRDTSHAFAYRYFDYQRFGPYVLAWVVKFHTERSYGSLGISNSNNYEYVLIGAATGEVIGCFDEVWRLRLN